MVKTIVEVNMYDLDELSKVLGLSRSSTRQYLFDNKIKGTKIGTKWFVAEKNLKDFLEA